VAEALIRAGVAVITSQRRLRGEEIEQAHLVAVE
jgi:hypothetical protein